MNRTGIFLALAGALALLALVLGVPPAATTPTPAPTPSPAPGGSEPPSTSSEGAIHLEGRLSHPYVPTGRSEVFLTAELTGAEVPGAPRLPVNLALVLDRSGSMAGEKLAQAKAAARQLVSQLRPEDRLAIIHYGSDVEVLPSALATDDQRKRMLRFIDRIEDNGGTNIGSGLSTARSVLRAHQGGYEVSRMILISDGQPTQGETDPAALAALAHRIRREGITVSALGVGTDFNEDLMQAIAERGSGAYAYLHDASQLATVFRKDLQQAATTVGRGVELSFELPDGVELEEVLGYHSVRDGRTVTVSLPDFSAGQVERVVARLAVTAPKAADRTKEVAKLNLRYTDLLKDGPVASSIALTAVTTDRKEVVLAKRDKDATVFAARAQSAANMAQAAARLKEGKRAEAKALLRENLAIFGEAAAVAGPAPVAADRMEQEALANSYDAADEEAEVEAAVKSTKARSLRGYGRIGSTY